ncbi:tetratricopeptide repeat protein [Sideroxydans sp.]
MTTDPAQALVEQTLQQAVELHRSGRAADAAELYQAVLSIQPKHPEANHELAVILLQDGQALAAIPHFLAALEADPERARFWLSYIDALAQAGQTDAAREVLQMGKQQGLQGEEVDALEARLSAGSRSAQPIKPGQKAPAQAQLDELVALFNQGRIADTAAHARVLTEQFPKHGFGWKVLGLALKRLGNNEEAISAMQKAATLSPKEADVHSNLGVALHDGGQLKEAEASYRRALKLKPDYADAHCNLGTLLQDMGKLEEAAACHRRALKLVPGLADAHYNLGNTLRAMGRYEEAVQSYRRALELRPDYAQACCNLGIALHELGQLDDAELMLRRALSIKPDYVEAHGNLGITLKSLGRQNEAEKCYQHALKINPDVAEIYSNLGALLHEMGELGKAESCYLRALHLAPDLPDVQNNFGVLMQDVGRLEAAESAYRRALSLKMNYFKAHSNLLFLLNYSQNVLQQTAFDEACRFGLSVTAFAKQRYTKWLCANQSPLRIGFVSGDFRNHPVGYFLENLLRYLDREAFELYAYPTDPWADELTTRLKSHFLAWHPLYGMNDEAAAKRIHDDGVHVLIDLSGHSRFNRLPVFAMKPAPMQVAWLGYFATTGMAEMDYLIADPSTLLASQERYFTEKIWRLPRTRLCFSRPDIEVEISPLPASMNGFVTFGCFNNLSKVNDSVIALWSRVLTSVADSRLFLKAKQLADAAVRQQTIERFVANGIAAERLILEGAESRAKYFEAYHRVDISLDPFPYPGGTTTVESLWMGVPVLNLAGDSFLSRQGAGLLINAGLPEWIASTEDEYIKRVVGFAADFSALGELRSELRIRVEKSPLMDGKCFAADFGEAVKSIWGEMSKVEVR